MNSGRMTLRILIALTVVLAFMSLALAERVPTKNVPISLKTVGAATAVPQAIKATAPTTPVEKAQADIPDRASKKAPAKPGLPDMGNRTGYLVEGFEGGVVPPTGWSQMILNSSYTWQATTSYVHSGSYGAYVPWDYSQDEWLISPALDFTGSVAADLRVSFWFNMSYYWSITPYDNYDLELWISTDGGATFPTKLWDEESFGTFSNWTWYEVVVSLAAYATETNVKLAWRYVGNDDADGAIDDIYVTDDPAPIGRCCYNLGANCKDNTKLECDGLGGSWDGTKSCATDPCPIPGVGDDCTNPIIVNLDTQLPYSDLNQYTCGRLCDYAGLTCLGYYDGGEDIVYRLDVTTAKLVTITLDPKGTTWTGFAVGTTCPPSGTCDLVKTNSGSLPYSGTVSLSPGTYYLMISTWPSPDCIPDFDLTIVEAFGPANDNCANAIDIGEVTDLAYSTAAATPDGPGGFIYGANIWYRYTASCDGAASVNLCNSNYDTKVRVFDGGACPTSTISLAENDDACGLQSIVTFPVVAGNQYMIEVGGYSSASGSGYMTIDCFLPPPNDNCASATPVPLVEGSPLTFTGDNTGCTSDCSLLGDPEVWHAFTTTECMNVTVAYCGTYPVFETVYIVLVDGCPCGSYVLGTYDFTSCGDGNATVRFKNLPAGTWYVPVLGDAGAGAIGPYTVTVSGIICPPPPPNDNCEDVVPTVLVPGVPVTFNGTTTGATADCDLFPGDNVWEAFTIEQCANVTLDYCGTAPAYGNAWLNLAIGCPCVSFTSAGAWDTYTCGDNNVTITWSGLAAGTYYYPVMNDPAYSADGPYTINIVANAVTSYCAAGASTCDEYISGVTVGTIDNYSDCGLSGGYSDYSALSTDMVQGLSYPILVQNGYPYSSDQCGIWVDWNGDYCFSVDEQIAVSGTPGGGPYTASIDAPCDATVGVKRLRIRLMWTGTVSPCGTTSYGEVEDYSINLLPHPPADPLATLIPNPQYAYYAHALDPIINTIYVGNFTGGFLAQDVNLSTVTVNGEFPTSVGVIPSYTGIYCGALMIQMPLADFIDNYGLLYDTTNTTFTVAGNFDDLAATPFSIDGEVMLIGHASSAPTLFIVPPTVVVLPGDFDASGAIDIGDPVAIISYIFGGGAAPANLQIGDADCSGSVDISDAVYIVAYIFNGGGSPCR